MEFFSSFTKIDLWSKGREIVDFLQYLCSNDVDIPIGKYILFLKTGPA